MSESSLIPNTPCERLCPYEQFQTRDDRDSNEIYFVLNESATFEKMNMYIYEDYSCLITNVCIILA